MKQIAINLYAGVSCTLHANPGVQCAHNLVDCPPRFRQTAVMSVRVSRHTTAKSGCATSSGAFARAQ